MKTWNQHRWTIITFNLEECVNEPQNLKEGNALEQFSVRKNKKNIKNLAN